VAKVEVKMPEEFLLKLSRLGERTDEIIPKVLEAGGEVVLSKVKSNLQSVIGSGTKYPSRATGELVNALGLSPAKQDRDGNHNIKIGFKLLQGVGAIQCDKDFISFLFGILLQNRANLLIVIGNQYSRHHIHLHAFIIAVILLLFALYNLDFPASSPRNCFGCINI
jgi:hypothetical protein